MAKDARNTIKVPSHDNASRIRLKIEKSINSTIPMSHKRPRRAQIQAKKKPGQENPRLTARRSPSALLNISNDRDIFQRTLLSLVCAEARTVSHLPSLFWRPALVRAP